MTDLELRELDAWIAEHFMGWKRLNSEPIPPAWETSDGHTITWESTSFGDAFQPTRLPAAFALVKREIERRHWEWDSNYSKDQARIGLGQYAFSVEVRGVFTWAKLESSEELAGCLAVKKAVEGGAKCRV